MVNLFSLLLVVFRYSVASLLVIFQCPYNSLYISVMYALC